MKLAYWIIGGVVVALCVVGLITYSGHKRTAAAEQKARQLTAQLQAAGLRVPQSQDIIIRSLGTDGGNVCTNPANALGKALLLGQLTNGAAQVGIRPVIVDRRILQGEALILKVYCPEKLATYRAKIDKLKTDKVLNP